MPTPAAPGFYLNNDGLSFRLDAAGMADLSPPVMSTALALSPVAPLLSATTAVNSAGERFIFTSPASEPGQIILTKRAANGSVAWTIDGLVKRADGSYLHRVKEFEWRDPDTMTKGWDFLAPCADGGVLVAVQHFNMGDVDNPLMYDWHSVSGAPTAKQCGFPSSRRFTSVAKYSSEGDFMWVVTFISGQTPSSVSGLAEGPGGHAYVHARGSFFILDGVNNGFAPSWAATGEVFGATFTELSNGEQYSVVQFTSASGAFLRRVGINSWNNWYTVDFGTSQIVPSHDNSSLIWTTSDHSVNYPNSFTAIQTTATDLNGIPSNDPQRWAPTTGNVDAHLASLLAEEENYQRVLIAPLDALLAPAWAGSLVMTKTTTDGMWDDPKGLITHAATSHCTPHANGDMTVYADMHVADFGVATYVAPDGTATAIATPVLAGPYFAIALRLSSTGAFVAATVIDGAHAARATSEKLVGGSGLAAYVVHDAEGQTRISAVPAAGGPLTPLATADASVDGYYFSSSSYAFADARGFLGFVHAPGNNALNVSARLLAPLTLTDATAAMALVAPALSAAKISPARTTAFTVPHSKLVVASIESANPYVAAKDLKAGSVTAPKLAAACVTSDKIASGTLTVDGDICPRTGTLRALGSPDAPYHFAHQHVSRTTMVSDRQLTAAQRSAQIVLPHQQVVEQDATFPVAKLLTVHPLTASLLAKTQDSAGVRNIAGIPLTVSVQGLVWWTQLAYDDVGALWQVYVNGVEVSPVLRHRAATGAFTLPAGAVLSVRAKAARGVYESEAWWLGGDVPALEITVDMSLLPPASVKNASLADGAVHGAKVAAEILDAALLTNIHNYLPPAPGSAMIFSTVADEDATRPAGFELVSTGEYTRPSDGSTVPKNDTLRYTGSAPALFDVKHLLFTNGTSADDTVATWRVVVNGSEISGDLAGKATSARFTLQPQDLVQLRFMLDRGYIYANGPMFSIRKVSPALPAACVWQDNIRDGAVTLAKLSPAVIQHIITAVQQALGGGSGGDPPPPPPPSGPTPANAVLFVEYDQMRTVGENILFYPMTGGDQPGVLDGGAGTALFTTGENGSTGLITFTGTEPMSVRVEGYSIKNNDTRDAPTWQIVRQDGYVLSQPLNGMTLWINGPPTYSYDLQAPVITPPFTLRPGDVFSIRMSALTGYDPLQLYTVNDSDGGNFRVYVEPAPPLPAPRANNGLVYYPQHSPPTVFDGVITTTDDWGTADSFNHVDGDTLPGGWGGGLTYLADGTWNPDLIPIAESTTYTALDSSTVTLHGEFVQKEFATADALGSISMYHRVTVNDGLLVHARCAEELVVLGSSDGTAWFEVGTFTGLTYAANDTAPKILTMTSTATHYKIYRFVCRKLTPNGRIWNVSEIAATFV